MFDQFRIPPESKFKIKDIDPDTTDGWKGDKEKAVDKLTELLAELADLQEVLYAEHKHKVLIVLQAMDTGGKDGTIRAVFEGVNPQGIQVASFKVPTPIEADHDYLWRVHARAPGKGELVIFNRSHYEEVLVVRVHGWASMDQTKLRYKSIRDFERMLVEEGTTIVKFFLHISRDEQRERLLERIDTPKKQWKFSSGDLKERAYWDDYMAAFEDAIRETSTEKAPWYVVPANRNWYRNLIVASVIVDTLRGLKMKYPEPEADIASFKSQL